MRKILMKLAVLACCVMMASCAGDVADSIDKAIDKGLQPLTEAQKRAHREALTNWSVGSETDEEAVNEFGYAKCFRVMTLTEGYTGSAEFLAPGTSADDLREVRALCYWTEPTDKYYHINIGTLICHKSIANDVLAILKQLYEEKYPILSLMPSLFNNPKSEIVLHNYSFCYSYDASGEGYDVGDKHRQGLAICLNPNPSYYPKDGDKAVTLFTQKGFTWNSQCEFVK